MSTIGLPNGLFTQGSIQVRGIDEDGSVSEPNQLPSIIVPYQPYNVIVRRNRMANDTFSNYTVTATCDIGSDVRLYYTQAYTGEPVLVQGYTINNYGRFTVTFDNNVLLIPEFYLSMTKGDLSGRSDADVILTTQASAWVRWYDNSVELLPSNDSNLGQLEVSLDGGITWDYWPLSPDNSEYISISLQDGLYLLGSIQTRRRIGNQVGDALPLRYNLIVPYQPLVTNIIRTAPMNYTIHGISIPNTEVEYSDIVQPDSVEVNEYGMFTITLLNYNRSSVSVKIMGGGIQNNTEIQVMLN